MTSLHEIGLHHGTDKAHLHEYTKFYDKLLRPYRNKPVTVVEIGVLGGNSLLMWQDWFTQPGTRIYGVELEDRPGLPRFDERTRIFINDAYQPNAVFDITNATGPIDVWIEDGSHFVKHQKDALRLWWPHIRSGGVAILEDTHSSYHYPWWDTQEEKFVHSLNSFIDQVNEDGANHCGVPTHSEVEEIIFRKSLVVIKKR